MDSNSVTALNLTDAEFVQNLINGVRGPGIPLWTREQIESEIRTCMSVCLRRDVQILAFILFRRLTHNIFEVSFLACLVTEQRGGFATRVFNQFLEIAADLSNQVELEVTETTEIVAQPKIIVIWLEVHEKNDAACAFYKKLGFKKVGRRSNYYSDGGSALLYSLERAK